MKPLLHADNISFSVEGRDLPILFPTNLKIFSGEFIVILGHNGSGKSTLIKLLTGESKPNTGSIHIGGKLLSDITCDEKAKNIITLTQRPEQRLFMNLTLEENIILWENRFGKNEQLDPLKILELTGKGNKLIKSLDQPISVFSGGEKQVILLALALAHPPHILFLDEHTSSLDPKASEEVMLQTAKAVEEHKITTVMVTHALEDAVKYGNRIIVLKEGCIVVDQKKNTPLSVSELKEMME